MNVLLPDTSIPAPYVCGVLVALLANNIVWSLISNTEELIIVLLPSIWRPPLIITNPVLSPWPAGSIINVEGVVKLPANDKESNVPTDVILGWAGVAIVPLILPATSRFWLIETSPPTCNLEVGGLTPIPKLLLFMIAFKLPWLLNSIGSAELEPITVLPLAFCIIA